MATRAAPPDLSKSRLAAKLGIVQRDRIATVPSPGYPGKFVGLRPLNPLESATAHERARVWAKAHGFMPGGESAERVHQVLASATGDADADATALGAVAGDIVELGHAIGRETLLLALVEDTGPDKGKALCDTVEELCELYDQPEQDVLLDALRDHEREIAPKQRECTASDVDEVVAAAKKGLTRIPSDGWPVSMLRGCVRTMAARLAKSTGST